MVPIFGAEETQERPSAEVSIDGGKAVETGEPTAIAKVEVVAADIRVLSETSGVMSQEEASVDVTITPSDPVIIVRPRPLVIDAIDQWGSIGVSAPHVMQSVDVCNPPSFPPAI